MRAGVIGTLHQLEPDGVIVLGEPIKLEPEYVRRDFRDLFNRSAAGATERVRHTGVLRGLSEQLVRTWPDHDRAAHRRHAQRGSVFAAEQLDLDRRQFRCRAIAGHHFDRIERRPVVLDAGVVARAAVAVFEREVRQSALRATAQIVDGWIPALVFQEIRASLVSRNGGNPGRDVVHSLP